jgi:predicted Rossmann fold nucleotide-binding protein DprA/Smf involved in DNA uptake
MNIGVVGNRTGWTYDGVRKLLQNYGVAPPNVIVTGGAEGVDTYAERYAREVGCVCIIMFPNPKVASPKRYFDRNKKIAEMCDVLIACDNKIDGSGTKNTIATARKLKKKVIVYKSEA